MECINHPMFGMLKMTQDIPEVNVYWWSVDVVFPNTNSMITIELHATPAGPSLIHERAYEQLLTKYDALLKSATLYNTPLLELNARKLAEIKIFAHGHIDLRFKNDEAECCVHADQNADFLTPSQAEMN